MPRSIVCTCMRVRKFVLGARLVINVVTEGCQKGMIGLSTCPFVCGWKVMMQRLISLIMQHISLKKRVAHGSPLSERTLLAVPYRKTQCFVNPSPTSCAVVVRKGTVLDIFENRSFVSYIAVFPLFHSGRGPRISMWTQTNGSVNRSNLRSISGFGSPTCSRELEVEFFGTF